MSLRYGNKLKFPVLSSVLPAVIHQQLTPVRTHMRHGGHFGLGKLSVSLGLHWLFLTLLLHGQCLRIELLPVIHYLIWNLQEQEYLLLIMLIIEFFDIKANIRIYSHPLILMLQEY